MREHRVTLVTFELLDVGKGSNAIVHIHADNCAGQNKNIVVEYLLWRVLTELHWSITLLHEYGAY